jgi:hypothetical protein
MRSVDVKSACRKEMRFMQQVQQRDVPERISWARAVVFAAGFFFLAAILIGQLPGYLYLQMTAATMEGLERGTFGLGMVCLGGFAVVQVIVLLFDPKPLIRPAILTGLGVILALAGLALIIWANVTGCTPTGNVATVTCNQYFPSDTTSIAPLLGGKFLWFQPRAIDFVQVGLVVLGVGLAMIFYSVLAQRELKNPDRRDMGTTPTIRWLIVGAVLLLILFLVFYTYVDNVGLGVRIIPGHPFVGLKLVNFVLSVVLGVAVLLALWAFALRLHYLMRPVRKTTMSGLYMIGALGLAQLGAILILAWIVVYPLLALIHPWTFIGLGRFLTVCARETAVPASCSFSPDAGYIIDTIVTSNFFLLFMLAIWGWKKHRSLVVIGGVTIVAVIAAATLVLYTAPDRFLIAMVLCGGMLVLAGIWTTVARREFAVIGENNLGCLGMWLVMGTCLFIYLASFAFFSLPAFSPETEPNIPFQSGQIIPPPSAGAADTATVPTADAVVMLIVLGIIAGIQFYFLTRNRYKA